VENGRIGIDIIKNSRKNLEELRVDLEKQIEKLQNNIPDQE
jgi:hypothetical protein